MLLVDELTLSSENSSFEAGYQNLSFGLWYLTAKFPDILDENLSGSPILRQGNYGFYVSGEKFLWGEKNNPEQGLAAYLRIGFADKNVNQFDAYYGGGIIYQGLLPGRDNDIIGLAVAAAHNDKKFRAKNLKEGHVVRPLEVDIEFTYESEITPFLHLQPDFQYVLNPSQNFDKSFLFIAGLRVSLKI